MEGEKGQHPEEVQKAGCTGSLKILGRDRISMHYCDLFVIDERGGRQEGAGESSEILVRSDLSVKSCQILYPAIFVA